MSREIEIFVHLVRRYVRAVDRASESTPLALLTLCARLLPHIYAAALELPDVEPATDELERTGESPSPMARLRSLLGRYDEYFEVYDPYVETGPIIGSLADDLADIYLDLVRPLAAFDAGETADAIWSWRASLHGHCGDHLVDAMRAIHRAVNFHMP
ncbi:MAG TPA: DUF5063 domain-containing protein [Nitrospira sp.]|nr:DUF5063 domain-containing protein [Nitrospira sp.]